MCDLISLVVGDGVLLNSGCELSKATILNVFWAPTPFIKRVTVTSVTKGVQLVSVPKDCTIDSRTKTSIYSQGYIHVGLKPKVSV